MNYDEHRDAGEAREIRVTWGAMVAAIAASCAAIALAALAVVAFGFIMFGGSP